MRPPRMTTRRWLVLVAVIGLVSGAIVGGLRSKRRQEYFGSLAKRFAACESICLNALPPLDKFIEVNTQSVEILEKSPDLNWPSPPGPSPLEEIRGILREGLDDRASWERKSAHYARLKVKYEYAARFPWLPVGPDPPEPE